MLQQTATSAPEPVPATEHLWRRDSVYYFRMQMPRELKRRGITFEVDGRPQKHEIKFSLRTSNHKKASSLVPLHALIWRKKFDAALEELQASAFERETRRLLSSLGQVDFATSVKSPQRVAAATILTDEQVRAIVIRHFIELQRNSAHLIDSFQDLDPLHQEAIVSDVGRDTAHYEGREGLPHYDVDACLARHLRQLGIEHVSPETPHYLDLRRGYRAGLIENGWRTYAMLTGQGPKSFDPSFAGIHADSPLPDTRGGVSIGELLIKFEKSQKDKRVSVKTHRANAPIFRALREHFGEGMPVAKIAQVEMVGFFDFLDTVPSSAAKRYQGKSLAEAASLESQRAVPRLLKHRSKANYHGRIVAIFEYAKGMGLITFNPATIPPLQARFHVEKKSDRPSFTAEELNTIFRAPLYTGCRNEKRLWFKEGSERPRGGKFWVPLLALFQGLRCNEACQLEIADILQIDGVDSLKVTDEADNSSHASGKRLKNRTSKNTLPIHPLLLRLGFLDFVKSRSTASDSSLLFPDLPQKKDGTFADLFSVYFCRFLKKTFADQGKPTNGTFHSFRHSFKDAMRRAKTPVEIADRLGRWASESRSVGQFYGDGYSMQMLRDELAKIEYPGLDLTHLAVHQ